MDALSFHELTKHTPASVRQGARGLDWSNKPHPFKEYLDLGPIPLPPTAPHTGVPATEATIGWGPDVEQPLDLAELARLLVLGAGVLRERRFADGERLLFRTYAAAGALYPVEIYVACAAIDGLEPGLYHFHPRERALRRVAPSDPRAYLARACGNRDSVAMSTVTFVLTGIPWRTTWKYGARGYRHLFWDGGMIVANLMALAASGGHAAEGIAGFVDDDVDALVGIDGRTEMALAVVPIGYPSEGDAPTGAEDVASTPEHAVAPLSPRPVEYPDLVGAHRAGALVSNDVSAWQRAGDDRSDPPSATPCPDGVEKVIRRRGSSRAFSRDPIPGDQLSDVVSRAMYPIRADWGSSLIEIAAIVNAVEGFEPGAYRVHDRQLQLLELGDFREVAYWLCLEQPLGGDAAVTLFLLAELGHIVSEYGSRGYRAAQLEAGIRGGRLYLGAYACRFGATGLTFYDDEVRKFFNTDLEPMLAIALGRPARGRRLL